MNKEETLSAMGMEDPEQKKDPVIKKKLELDIDVSQHNSKDNPYQKLIFLAKAVDAWRIFPRIFVSVYIFLLYKVVIWFMSLEDPSLEQSGLVSIVVGAMAAVFGIYAGTSGQSKKFKGED
jgi:hypothetical protein|tara:strand:+ start:4305 stop:4667 length:363 start_codon:yes stop_codon:yes gene_type:complete